MENPDQDQQDLRCVPGVEDTTTMTIEFLRDRLLSERYVSKSARQRADELAKRVAKLEEQLKIVSLQRKVAEKATADVLSILKNNGASDISETLDSHSDHETFENDPARENVNSNSTRRRNEPEEYSGSDIDTSLVLGGSLSWKGRNDSAHTREKYKKISVRSRNSFTSIGSSPKHHAGRSCGQIKHRDERILVNLETIQISLMNRMRSRLKPQTNMSHNAFLANELKPLVAIECVSRDSSEAQTSRLGPSLCADVEDLQEQQNTNSVSTSRSLDEFTFPMANVKQCQESQENSEQEPSFTSRCNHGLPERPLSSHGGISLYDQEILHSNRDLYAFVPHEPPALNGVLEALKQVKLSLTKKINKLPSVKEMNQLIIPLEPILIQKLGIS